MAKAKGLVSALKGRAVFGSARLDCQARVLLRKHLEVTKDADAEDVSESFDMLDNMTNQARKVCSLPAPCQTGFYIHAVSCWTFMVNN